MDRGHRIWALLVGVESYFQGKERPLEYHRLNGCVRDVRAVEEYLRRLGVQNIKTLTASGEKDPIENHRELPIYENIEREFQYITDNAGVADLVYFHYSGHGIRRDVLGQRQKDDDTITGTALALADVMTGGAYLTGYQLGVFVKKMVEEKGLRVTLVLDSCFSGQGLRNSSKYAPRTIVGQSDNSLLNSDVRADQTAASADKNATMTGRAAHVKRSWLSNPSGCTVLTACQFDETAGENKFPDMDGAHGVLTYWMLKALADNPLVQRPTHAKIRDYVQSKIMRMKPGLRQSPVLYGDGDYVFLGNEAVVERPACRILKQWENYVELDIGQAQGASIGAIYDIYPENSSLDNMSGCRPRLQAQIVEVAENSIFLSTAELFAEDSRGLDMRMEVGLGGIAVLRTWALPSDVYIDVSLLESSEKLRGINLEKLTIEIERTSGLYLQTDSMADDPSFNVILNANNELEIESMGVRIPRVPRISIEDTKWIEKVAYLLSHLARFEALRTLPNDYLRSRNSLPVDWFSYTAKGKDLRPIKEVNGRYHAKGESVYVSFYCLSSAWGIQKIHPGPGQTAIKLPRRRLESFRIDIEASSVGGDNSEEIEDTIRAFICTREVSWEELTLPDISMEEIYVPRDPLNEIMVVPQYHGITTAAQNTDNEGLSSRNMIKSCFDEEDGPVLCTLDLIIRTAQE
ncbi:hypothetical protein TWF970_004868 [Orbilia oligospora]|uniref:Peptidase C14 caspase domain-containing protein n=1 Tax=Orbilia oligospora TaxID=2813651 RepID=A0A7C8RBL0_ORBOL|nr:hypothetical protein TWF970_004868 [Orbilia oligospora]